MNVSHGRLVLDVIALLASEGLVDLSPIHNAARASRHRRRQQSTGATQTETRPMAQVKVPGVHAPDPDEAASLPDLLPRGEYPVTVAKCELKNSKTSGGQHLAVELVVRGEVYIKRGRKAGKAYESRLAIPEGCARTLTEYISVTSESEFAQQNLASFLLALGFKSGEELDTDAIAGRSIVCTLQVEKPKPDSTYDDRQRVAPHTWKAVSVRKAEAAVANPQPASKPATPEQYGLDDDVPF